MKNTFIRTEKLIGTDKFFKLQNAHILIVGIGGVGGYVLETLVRSGIGKVTIIDGDRVEESNLNRQIIANQNTIGKFKVDAAQERMLSINTDVIINKMPIRYDICTNEQILNTNFDYCIDCFDSVKEKIDFIVRCKEKGYNIISAMGAGNRIDCDFKVLDIFDTAYDGLAKVVRKGLKERGINALKCVCDSNSPIITDRPPASISYVPAIMGCIIAKEVIKDLIG